MEATVKHLEAVYPLSKYEKVRAAFGTIHGLANLAGLCFLPTRSGDAVVGNFTNGFDIVLVKWTSTPAGPISFFTSADYMSTPGIPETASAADLRLDLMDIDTLSGWDEFHLYNDSSEFEVAFIDRQTFEYLAVSNVFYSGGTVVGFRPGFPNRGLLISRAFITMQGGSAGNSYQRFRTLRAAPYPEPPIPTDAAGRASIAYYIASPCPPYWQDQGAAAESSATSSSSTGGGGTGDVAPSPMMFSTEQMIYQQGNPDDCNCVVNKINKVELHQRLIEEGLIPKEPPPIYKMRLWPWILLAAIIALLAVVGLVDFFRGDTFFLKSN